MTAPVFTNVKIAGQYADTLREESVNRRVSLASLVTEYALEGIEARQSPDGDKLAGFERRVASTVLALRGDVESLTATVDVLVAMTNALSKLLLVHLPEPSADSLSGVMASAQSRHEVLLKSVAEIEFENDRPVALMRIVELLSERLEMADE